MNSFIEGLHGAIGLFKFCENVWITGSALFGEIFDDEIAGSIFGAEIGDDKFVVFILLVQDGLDVVLISQILYIVLSEEADTER